jgi:hypothetical protein
MSPTRIAAALLATISFLAIPLAAIATGTTPPIKISVKNPDGLGTDGILLSADWVFILELEVKAAVGVIDEGLEPDATSNMALILRDPDGCINMQNWSGPGQPLFPIEGCSGPPDETFIRFTPDLIDAVGFAETTSGNGVEELQLALRDDLFDPLNLANLNRQYYTSRLTTEPPGSGVGVLTELDTEPDDSFGHGANDDLPGLYVWAKIGTNIVTDEFLNPVNDPVTGARKLRNMAGLFNTVSYTQLANNDITSIVTSMNVERGVLEPIVQFDFISVHPFDGTTSVGFLRQLDGGPIVPINFPDATPRGQNAAYTEVFDSLPPYEVIISAAVVQGTAQPFIQDLDANGTFNKRDLILAGHTLLSNVVTYKVRAIAREAIDTGGFECPTTRIYKEAKLDTDTDGSIGCSTGSARSIVRPPR